MSACYAFLGMLAGNDVGMISALCFIVDRVAIVDVVLACMAVDLRAELNHTVVPTPRP